MTYAQKKFMEALPVALRDRYAKLSDNNKQATFDLVRIHDLDPTDVIEVAVEVERKSGKC